MSRLEYKRSKALFMVMVFSIVGIMIAGSLIQDVSAAGKFEGLTLNVNVETGPHGTAVRKLAPIWEKMTGAKIRFTVLPGWPELYEKTKLELAIGNGITDIHYVCMPWLVEMHNDLLSLNQFIDKPEYTKEILVEDFVAIAREEATFNGQLYGFPTCNEAFVMAYRTDLFEKYGVAKVPETLDELLDAAKKLNHPDEGIYGAVCNGKRGAFPYWEYYWILRSMGGDIFDKEGNPVLDQPLALKALNYQIELYKYANPASLAWSHFESLGAFAEGAGAMMVSWHGNVEFGAADPSASKVAHLIDTAVPPGERLPDGSIRSGFCGSAGIWLMAIDSNSKNKEAAFDFLAFTTGTTNAKLFVTLSHELVRYSVLKDPDCVAELRDKALPEAVLLSTSEPRIPQYQQMVDIIGLELSNALAGIKSATKALTDANKSLLELVE